MRWMLAAIVLVAACSKSSSEEAQQPAISDAEVQRSLDACNAYVAKLCACTAEPAKQECKLATLIPESIEVARSLAQNPKAEPADSAQAAASIRKTVKRCVEETVKLPELGCM
jgi:hypothetical protein